LGHEARPYMFALSILSLGQPFVLVPSMDFFFPRRTFFTTKRLQFPPLYSLSLLDELAETLCQVLAPSPGGIGVLQMGD